MVRAPVFFIRPDNISERLPGLIQATGFLDCLRYRKKVGVKLHFGEDGNRNHLKPEYVRVVVDQVGTRVTDCALLETCTLYRGRRARARSHKSLAHEHGFTLARVLAPVEIIDGEQGDDYYEVPTGLQLVPRARLGRGLRHIHALVNLVHFKGHFVTGFGGVFKNLGMGLAAKGGKLEMHSRSKPAVGQDKCRSCGECVDYCPNRAIDFVREVARIGRSCTGCAGCIMVCPQNAITIAWNEVSPSVSKKVVEYAWAVLRDPVHGPRPALHLNFVLNVTPNCDCMGTTEDPVMPDVGVFASLDPVACEQAAYDRCRAVLTRLYPHLEPQSTIDYAEALGLGSRRYRVTELR